IVRRHEVLRTTLHADRGQPAQRIAPAAPLALPVVDLSELPESARESEARRLAMMEVRRPFDLSRDLMLRAVLLRLGEQEHIFLLTLHHIASDGWSLDILFMELTSLYASLSAGLPP